MSERTLTKDEIKRLALHGIRYPWSPWDMLRALERMHPKERIESGVLRFGDDWPGLFLRGDTAMGYAGSLQAVLDHNVNFVMLSDVRDLLKELLSPSTPSAEPTLIVSWELKQ